MALNKRVRHNIEIKDNGVMFIITTTDIIDTNDNNKVVGQGVPNRQPFDPGVNKKNDLPVGRARRIATAEWTPAVVKARKDELDR